MPSLKRVIEGCYQIPLRGVNAYLLDTIEGLVLVDTGFPGREGEILSALKQLGREPQDLKHIVLTHAHPDHVGSASAIVQATSAETWMHADDIPVAEGRSPFRPIHAFPGILPKLVFAMVLRAGPARWPPIKIDHAVADGDVLPFGGLRVLHAPGHCKGQIALLSSERRLLVAADTCVHFLSLRGPVIGEDQNLALDSLKRLSRERFETAVFGHGRAIVREADQQFRRAFTAV